MEGPPSSPSDDSFRAMKSSAKFSSSVAQQPAEFVEPAVAPTESIEPADLSEKYYQGTNAARHINEANLPVKTPPLDSLDIKWEQWGNPHAPDDKTIGEQALDLDGTFEPKLAAKQCSPCSASSRRDAPRVTMPRHASLLAAARTHPQTTYQHSLYAHAVIFPSFSHGSHAKSSAENETPGWWEFIIGPNEYLDTNKYRIICPSFIGSPHGATNPTTWNPATDRPYGPDFPHITRESRRKVYVTNIPAFSISS